ncbi:hypothetical protein D3C74_137610 [compost metagenome]
MTLNELKTLLKATGYPVAYLQFKATPNNPAPKPPFITYIVDSSSNFFADNVTYSKASNVSIELYTNTKDLNAESKLESLLDEIEIPYDSYETYIDSEDLYQKIYEARL